MDDSDTQQKRYWLKHKELEWAACTKDGNTFKDENGQLVEFTGEEDQLHEVDESHLKGVPDILNLDNVCPGGMLNTVRVRYDRDEIYTCLAKVLVALNPFQRLPIYGEEVMQKYLDPNATELDPHAYGLGRDAVISLKKKEKKGQAVLVSGESGAGKTETVKTILSYIGSALDPKNGAPQERYNPNRRTSRYGSSANIAEAQADLNEQIMQTNPVLESFGNSKTCRNDNSSRFGKWMQIAVDSNFAMSACFICDYVLELTRVCGRSASERNYHIFYQVIETKDEEMFKPLNIQPAEHYKYLEGLKKVPVINDKKNQDELLEAFQVLAFSDELQIEIFKVVVGILNLGNLEYNEIDADSCELKDEGPITAAAEMLGVDQEALKNSFIQQRMTIGGQAIDKPCNTTQATSRSNAVARLIYGGIFKWLIEKINQVLSGGKSTADADKMDFFGMLDMAGFESLEKNSLEQMFINLCNEKLQRHFNAFFFELELEHYSQEGLTLNTSDFKFTDNMPIIDMILGDPSKKEAGILGMLDEELKVNKATDLTFVGKVGKQYGKSQGKEYGKTEWLKPEKSANICKFKVKHFAGEVEYDCDGFLAKNNDKLPEETIDYLQKSTLSVLKDIGNKLAEGVADGGGGGKKKQNTVCNRFRESLGSLMQKLTEAQPHFIRCIKPNVERVKSKFTGPVVMDQLLYSGVMELVTIHMQGFPHQEHFDNFMHCYKVLVPQEKWLPQEVTDPEECKTRLDPFLECLREDLSKTSEASQDPKQKIAPEDIQNGMQVGKSKIFLKASIHHGLQKMRSNYFAELKKRQEEAVNSLKEATKSRDCSQLEDAIQKTKAIADFGPPELDKARDVLEFEKNLENFLTELNQAVESKNKEKLQELVSDAEKKEVDRPEVTNAKKVHACIYVDEAVEANKYKLLEDAIELAKKADLTGDNVGQAKQMLQSLEAAEKTRNEVRTAIEEAIKAHDVDKLRQAIEKSEEVDFDPEEKENAKIALAREERLVDARAGLKAASEEQDMEKLTSAIQEGEEAGLSLDDASFMEAKETLKKLQKEENDRKEAAQAIEQAMDGFDLDAIRAAVAKGEALKVDQPLLDSAHKKIKEEECREGARNSLKLALQKQGEVEGLKKAIEEGQAGGLSEKEMEFYEVILTIRIEVVFSDKELAPGARRADKLKAALEEADKKQVTSIEIDEARGVLQDFERKDDASDKLNNAMEMPKDSKRCEALREAVQACRDAHLEAAELKTGEQALEEEEVREKIRATLNDGVKRRNTTILREALVKGKNAGVLNQDMQEANDVLITVQQDRKKVREDFQKAVKEFNLEAQEQALKEGEEMQAFTPEQIGKARKDIAKTRQRREIIEKLQEASSRSDINGVKDALREADEAQIRSDEITEAREKLKHMEKMAEAEDEFRLAWSSDDATAAVKREAALLKLKEIGVDEQKIEDMSTEVKAQAVEKLRRRLFQGEGTTPGDLAKAFMEGAEAGLDQSEVDEFRRMFWRVLEERAEADRVRYEQVKDLLMPKPRQLALEVFFMSLQVEGCGSMTSKSGFPVFCSPEVGERLLRVVKESWANKEGTVLDELLTLRMCVVGDDGTGPNSKELDLPHLYRICAELSHTYENSRLDSDTAVHFPLALMALFLFSQHEVDTDRMMLFQDCPSARQPADARDKAYAAYRERVQKLKGERNPCPDASPVFMARAWAALATLLDTLDPPEMDAGNNAQLDSEEVLEAKAALEKAPLKLMCMLDRMTKEFECPLILCRYFPDLPDRTLERLQALQRGDTLCWMEGGSATYDVELCEEFARATEFPDRGLFIEIENVTHGLDISEISVYPKEKEVILPMGTLVEVDEVDNVPGRYLRIKCTYQSSMIGQEFKDACWTDLVIANDGLRAGLEPTVEPEPTPSAPKSASTGATQDPSPGSMAKKQHRFIGCQLLDTLKPIKRRLRLTEMPAKGDTVACIECGEWTTAKVLFPIEARAQLHEVRDLHDEVASMGVHPAEGTKLRAHLVKLENELMKVERNKRPATLVVEIKTDGGAVLRNLDLNLVWKEQMEKTHRTLVKMTEVKDETGKIHRKHGKATEVRDLKSLFEALDTDEGGTLDVNELANGFRRLDIAASHEDIVSFLESLDANQDNNLTLAELEDGLNKVKEPPTTPSPAGARSPNAAVRARSPGAAGYPAKKAARGPHFMEPLQGSDDPRLAAAQQSRPKAKPAAPSAWARGTGHSTFQLHAKSPVKTTGTSAPSSPPTKLSIGSAGPGQDIEAKLRPVMAIFRAMDRRGVMAISRDDFQRAVKICADQKDFQKIVRTPAVCEHFFRNPYDLTLHRFLWLVAPHPRGQDSRRWFQCVMKYLKDEKEHIHRATSPRNRSPGGELSPRAESPMASPRRQNALPMCTVAC